MDGINLTRVNSVPARPSSTRSVCREHGRSNVAVHVTQQHAAASGHASGTGAPPGIHKTRLKHERRIAALHARQTTRR